MKHVSLSRRRLLGVASSSLFAALAAQALDPRRAFAADATPLKTGPSRAVILLWLNGGPSHIDTFDPKPGTPTGGSHKAIKTAIPGVLFAEHLPQLAASANKLAVIRGMTTKEGNHQRAQYLVHTGYAPNPTIAHPSLGGWVSHKMGAPDAGLPAFVSIGGPSFGGGFLGVENGPFVLQKAGDAPPNLARSGAVDEARFDARRKALDGLEARFALETGDPKVEGRRALYGKAFRMMGSPKVHAFELDDEPAAVRASFGDTDFGRGCLVASRLVASGVRFVEVVLDGWDTHQDNFTRTKKLMETLDGGMAGLLKDLEVRGLLATTTVMCMGEFGRTPRINGNDGRDHYPQAWSALMAGAGIRGGVVHGETDASGGTVVKDKTTVPDLLATAATVLGLNPGETVISPIGRPISLTDEGHAIKQVLA